ncbi:MAG: hypothetical protein K1X57_14355 [Gemmataceae bacterium]|nr:hypothetical protein [Gemmataceae bacterium]
MSHPVPPFPDHAAPFGAGGQARVTPWYLDFAGVLRRHPVVILLSLALCGGFGFFVGGKYKTNLWTIEGRERFVKTPLTDGTKVAYDSMSLQASADLFQGEDLLKPVVAEFADRLPKDNPIRYLQREIKVDTPRFIDIIELKYDAAEPEFGVALVNRLMERHIEYTNQYRRKSLLRAAAENLKHKIAEADSSVRRLQRTIDDYRSRVTPNTPIEKLETADLDSATIQRRKSLIDDIDRVKSRIKELQATLRLKQTEYVEAEKLLQQRAIPAIDLTKIEREVAVLKSQIQTNEEYITTTERKYREVPLEYFDSKITDLKSQRTTAELDLKLLLAKIEAARTRNVSPVDVDPEDDEWTKLRTKLMGPDNPEFEIIKPATAPAFATVSNRKMLSLGAAAGPLGLIFLILAFIDRRSTTNLVPAPMVGPPTSSYRLPKAEVTNGHSGSGRQPKPLP